MNIDPSRVNVLEKDVEQWLFENPNAVKCDDTRVEQWTLRQFRLPSGIVDLIGVGTMGETIVVEVKNVEITSDALAQVSRYAADLSYIVNADDSTWITKVVIGRGKVDNKLMFEAAALGVNMISFDVSLSLEISGQWKWNEKYRAEINRTLRQLSECDDIKRHKDMADIYREEFIRPADEEDTEADNGI